MQLYLTSIETSGNQAFIFATNKLQENIGASELTYRAGTRWVLEAIEEVLGKKAPKLWNPDATKLRRHLLDRDRNRAIEDPKSLGIEVLVAASGKAMLLTKSRETAKQIVRYVTRAALERAPGLDVCGVTHGFDWEKEPASDAIDRAHKAFADRRTQRATPQHRFQRLPVVRSCATSGQPAATAIGSKGDRDTGRAISAMGRAKILAVEGAKDRLFALRNTWGVAFAGTTGELDEICDWLAVVHADGNGLGKIFKNFHQHIGATSPAENRKYVDALRRFSIALDRCTEAAFKEAARTMRPTKSGILPIAPLVLGGDDLTVVGDGRYALQFTRCFLEAFEKETASKKHCDGIVPAIAQTALHADRLSACAGVSIIKPHFPFSTAYDLAESLIRSAKTVKQQVKRPGSDAPFPCSAIDFHILYDSSAIDLDAIRQKLVLGDRPEKQLLYARPYVVTPLDKLQSGNVAKDGEEWCRFHHWQGLRDRIHALKATDGETGDRRLPSNQMHDLRGSLFLGKDASDARFRLVRKRYEGRGIQTLEGDSNSLFAPAPSGDRDVAYSTGFLDALESLEFFDSETDATTDAATDVATEAAS